MRGWCQGDVRGAYYTVLGLVTLGGILAMRAATPIGLLKLAANVASAVFVVASLHLLYINTRFLPPEIRPPMWRRTALVAMSLFYGFFVALSLRSLR